MVTVQLSSDSEKDYIKLLRNIREYNGNENIFDSIRLYNSDTFDDPIGRGINTKKKLLAFYSFTNTKEKQEQAIVEIKKLMSKEIKSKFDHEIVKFEYDDYKFTNLTKPEEWRSYHIDCYLPITKIPDILDISMPATRTKFSKDRPQEVIKEAHKAFDDTLYEIHLIDNSALLRIYPIEKSAGWIDRVTSSVLHHKGVIYSKKEVLDEVDPNLIPRIVGTESEQIQKEIKRIFDDKDLLERYSVFDVTYPTFIQRVKDKHPIYNYVLSKLFT